MELQNLFEVFIFINLIPQAPGRSAFFGTICSCSLKVDYHLRLDSIAVSVFVNIGWVSIRTKDPNNHSNTETGTLSFWDQAL